MRRIQLQFFGGVSEIEKESETPGREFVLAFVGPLLSLVLAGVFYLGMQAVEPGTVPGVLLAGLMISNLIVAAFNLLPGLPLDGGRMLRAVVWKITGKPMTGTVAAAWVGRALAVAVLIGLPLLTHTGALGNAPRTSAAWTPSPTPCSPRSSPRSSGPAPATACAWPGCANTCPSCSARALTRRAVPVETDTPLSEALRRANEAGARALVVVDGHGDPDRPRPRGRHRRRTRTPPPLGRRQRPRPGPHRRHAGLRRTGRRRPPRPLRATPATEYLVVEETGEIYGVLSTADVERAFVKAMARPTAPDRRSRRPGSAGATRRPRPTDAARPGPAPRCR